MHHSSCNLFSNHNSSISFEWLGRQSCDFANITTFGAALVRGFLSEDWARGTLELPALPALHLPCRLGGPAIYRPISLVSRKALIKLGRSKPSTGPTIPEVAVRISRLSNLKSVRISELLLSQPIS